MTYSTKRELIDAVISEYNRAVKCQIERLYYCKAWIIQPDNSEFVILQSYSTIVAAYQFSTSILWVFGFYSRTTASHIAKFWNWLCYDRMSGLTFPKVVKLYNDSRTGKRAARKNLEDDFASVISTALNQS